MADIDFPVSLPSPRMGTPGRGYIAPWVEDAPDAGSARRRSRFTRTLRTFSPVYRLTDAQMAVLDTFVVTTTQGGALPFNWTHPRTATAHEVRFGGMPQSQPVDGAFGVHDVTVTLVEI